MKQKMILFLYGVVLVLGWFAIQFLFKSIPFSSEDLGVNYYIAKAVVQSVYVMMAVGALLYGLIHCFFAGKE
ncbi:hypothetical protein [Enterococcus diestrammenae]|uniref:hypothetical protein n=1 Tax=Enterococcus diestrammenae TaxID=1155073 RepID=UPI0022DEDB40|nr:hypothetical protein [Enterococcus diestrammenae]